jgi:hypothetical protein
VAVDPARLDGHILSTDGAFCMRGRPAYIVAVPAPDRRQLLLPFGNNYSCPANLIVVDHAPVALGAHGAYQSSSPQAPVCDSAADECRYLLGTQSFLLRPE